MAFVKNKVNLPANDGMPAAQGCLADMLKQLSAPESGARRAAVRDLAAYPEAAMALCDRLEVEGSLSVRSVIMNSLIHAGTTEVASRLVSHLRSDDAQLRNAAIEALQEMPDAVAPHMRDLLADDDSDIRIFAVNILAALRHKRAPEWLAEVIRSDSHVNVCAAAVDGLIEVGGADVIPDLEALERRFADVSFMRFAIEAAIRRIRGE
ncbi:MAG TPA: HEAT repeat domain-containing protein [Skermanella sp.]|jgi:HEAT repeat protein|nr:HEAT repeat domain-containing protein [Skermanella sp.]